MPFTPFTYTSYINVSYPGFPIVFIGKSFMKIIEFFEEYRIDPIGCPGTIISKFRAINTFCTGLFYPVGCGISHTVNFLWYTARCVACFLARDTKRNSVTLRYIFFNNIVDVTPVVFSFFRFKKRPAQPKIQMIHAREII